MYNKSLLYTLRYTAFIQRSTILHDYSTYFHTRCPEAQGNTTVADVFLALEAGGATLCVPEVAFVALPKRTSNQKKQLESNFS